METMEKIEQDLRRALEDPEVLRTMALVWRELRIQKGYDGMRSRHIAPREAMARLAEQFGMAKTEIARIVRRGRKAK